MTTQIQQTLAEIKQATGWSQTRIAAEIGTSQPTVNRLENGQAECKASTWQALLALRERVCVAVPPAGDRRRSSRRAPSVTNLT